MRLSIKPSGSRLNKNLRSVVHKCEDLNGGEIKSLLKRITKEEMMTVTHK